MKIVKLLEPDLCLECAACELAEYTMPSGYSGRMIKCLRLDCDNWSVEETELPKSVDGAPLRDSKITRKWFLGPAPLTPDDQIPCEDGLFVINGLFNAAGPTIKKIA